MFFQIPESEIIRFHYSELHDKIEKDPSLDTETEMQNFIETHPYMRNPRYTPKGYKPEVKEKEQKKESKKEDEEEKEMKEMRRKNQEILHQKIKEWKRKALDYFLTNAKKSLYLDQERSTVSAGELIQGFHEILHDVQRIMNGEQPRHGTEEKVKEEKTTTSPSTSTSTDSQGQVSMLHDPGNSDSDTEAEQDQEGDVLEVGDRSCSNRPKNK